MSWRTISLCMIVRNEAEALPRCLESVERAVDEVIVVDTGSTDDTVAIARSFGAKVVHFPWRDDFSAARNAGIEHAKGDWIFVLDADEMLNQSDKEKLRICAQNESLDGLMMLVYNYTGDGSQVNSIGPVLRMFKNRPEHRFEGRIHEQIAHSIYRHNPNAILIVADIQIHHYGYMNDAIIQKDKINRNFSLLQQMLAEDPNEPFTLFNIGMEYMRVGQLNRALESFRAAKPRLNPAYLFSHSVFYKEIQCMHMLGQFSEAIGTCDEAISLYPDYTDLYMLKGFSLMQSGRLEEAAAPFRRADELGDPPKSYIRDEGIGTFDPCYMRGLVYEGLRDYSEALDCYFRAYSRKPGFSPPLNRMFRLMTCVGMASRIPAVLKKKLNLQSEEVVAQLIGILLEGDHARPALALAERMKSSVSQDLKAEALLKCRLLLGKDKEARRTLRLIRDEYRQAYSALLDWLEKGSAEMAERLALRTELIPLGVKAAVRRGRTEDGLSLFRRWRSEMFSPEAYNRKVLILSSLADFRLDSMLAYRTDEYADIIQDARRAFPYHDGF